jgi:hypothetical protein
MRTLQGPGTLFKKIGPRLGQVTYDISTDQTYGDAPAREEDLRISLSDHSLDLMSLVNTEAMTLRLVDGSQIDCMYDGSHWIAAGRLTGPAAG